MSDPIRDCQHGHKKGKCDACDLIEAEKTIAAQAAELASLRADVYLHSLDNDRLRSENKELQAVAEAVLKLPVEEWVEADLHGNPVLVGYVMEARGEWDAVLRALRAAGYLSGEPQRVE